ncbi:MAG: hypothetical protein JSS14_00680 [Proteobacteria bacterium]|nr:hypothetical protein [Pseudomonadota bacterium]
MRSTFERTCIAALCASGAMLLQACGGGGSEAGGDSLQQDVQSQANGASISADAGSTQGTAPVDTASETSEQRTFIQRAVDTVNPVAARGSIDIELSADLASSPNIKYWFEAADGTSAPASRLGSSESDDPFFAQTPTLQRINIPAVSPGAYTLKAKGPVFDEGSETFVERSAALPVEINALDPAMATLSYSAGLSVNGSNRLLPIRYTSITSGALYLYTTGEANGTCAIKSLGELEGNGAIRRFDVEAKSYGGGAYSSSETALSGASVADADTVCMQFVRADGAVEKPYTFNVRYVVSPESSDAILPLGADSRKVPKKSLALMSIPKSESYGGHFDWFKRLQILAAGDVRQQRTEVGRRSTLEESGGTWQYRIAKFDAADPPFFKANVEGRPPLVFFVKQ